MRRLLYLLIVCAFCVTSGFRDPDPLRQWKAGTRVSAEAVRHYGVDRCFSVEPVSDAVFSRMKGKSYPEGCPIARSDLRYVKALHVDAQGHILLGEMVCNKAIATDVKEILQVLFTHRYPIERMVLIDDYDANDERSMRANNSSCFCYRVVSGKKTLSKHARGMAVDLNTLYNPFCHRNAKGVMTVEPSTAQRYADRTKEFPYKIEKGDLCYQQFIKHGFRWGGSWRYSKDYQHFEK